MEPPTDAGTWPHAVTFAAAWRRAVAVHPTASFLTFQAADGVVTSWTYGDFDDVVGRMAQALTQRGLTPGRAVHLALTNSPTFVAAWLATTQMGGWIVPSDPMSRTPELADHIARTQPVVGLCSIDRSEIYAEAAPLLDRIVIDESDVTFGWLPAAPIATRAEPALRDRAAIMFTSGTTGRPKGVEISQANYAFAGKVMAEAAALTDADRQLVVLPLFHANAQYYSFAPAIWVGASVVLMHAFSASGFLTAAADHGATCASLFAAPMRMILTRGAPVDGVALRHCWYAQNVTNDQYVTLTDWLGCSPRQLYGMTETIPAVLSDAADEPRPASMGFVTPGCHVALQRLDGDRVAPGETGEIVVAGEPGITLFAGYLDDPAATRDAFTDGWFRTGDRARRDDDGRWYFDGRRSDVLKVAGENVSTVEVEAVLSAHPGVLEASVIGTPDPVRDEVPLAFVVPADPACPPSVEELDAWCRERLAKAKLPHSYRILDELPRTSVGKIRKYALQEAVR